MWVYKKELQSSQVVEWERPVQDTYNYSRLNVLNIHQHSSLCLRIRRETYTSSCLFLCDSTILSLIGFALWSSSITLWNTFSIGYSYYTLILLIFSVDIFHSKNISFHSEELLSKFVTLYILNFKFTFFYFWIIRVHIYWFF